MILRNKKLILLVISFSLLFSASGCAGNDNNTKEEKDSVLVYNGAVNTTIDADSKWYNSSIYGAIDDSLNVNLKDDFYTAVNKEWIVNHRAPTEDEQDDNFVSRTSDKVKERLINIISGRGDEEAAGDVSIDISEEELEHDLKLVMQFAKTASDWDERNKSGAEPVRPYIEAIERISSMDDMDRYIADFEGDNLSFEYMLQIASVANLTEADAFQTVVTPSERYSLYDIKYYMDMNIFGRATKRRLEQIVNKVLSDLGYSQEAISKILTECYRFEGMLADHTNTALGKNESSFRTGYSLDELDELSGDYPIREIIKAIGYDITEDFRLTDRSYLKYLGRIYNESNLELMKSYYIVHTVNFAARLLDRDSYDAVTRIENENDKRIVVSTVPKGDGDRNEEEIRDEWDLVLSDYLREALAGPLDIVYVSRYCSDEQKQKITELVEETIDKYHGVIDSADWLSESARESAKEKLDHITVRVLYPDNFDSYLELIFEEDDTLPEMIQKINCFQAKLNARDAGTKPDRNIWNLDQVSTSVSNAYYMPNDNSINILAGIISTGDAFDPDREEEINMACIGTIIGHEISHAFDSTGCYYDKSGNQQRWWDNDDLTAFQMKVDNIDRYYGTINPYPGAPVLTNTKLSGEVIADMGGMQIMLELAKNRTGFDYDLFFKSYAELWRNSCSFGVVLGRIEEDPHPLAFLRTNVTAAQFDEFIETYDISEGDGMYLEKDKRIKIW